MNKELFLALEIGDVRTVQILHGQNSLVLLDVTFQGDTPLHIAAREGHLPVLQWILVVEPSLAGARNKDGNTPLHEAAKCVNPELLRILLQHKKSSAYHYNKLGETVLIIASRYGHVQTVKLLLEGRGFNDALETHQSFKLAVYGGYPDVAKAILTNPNKPQQFSRRQLVLLEWDTYAGVPKAILHNLIKIFSRKIIYEIWKLHIAVHGGHLEIVEAVLNSCAWKRDLMTTKDKFGRCAIHVAAMKGRWDIINQFMSRWPDCVEIRSSDHKSVLHFAIEYNQIQIVQNVLADKKPEKRVELVSRDHDLLHNTALHLAAKKRADPQVVEYLVSFPGVHVNALNDENMTALDIASAAAKDNPNCAIIEQILEAAGGIRSSLIPKSNTTSDPVNNSKQGGEREIVNTHMVVASLIATVTFAAIFQIPGGIEDDIKSVHYGTAKIAFRKLFKLFIFSDTAAFTTSFTVVVAWLLRQLVGDTYFRRSLALSHMSVVALLASIFWTTVALVSIALIVLIPPDYKSLKSKDKKAFQLYNQLKFAEICIAIIPPLYIGIPLFPSISGMLFERGRFKLYKLVLYLDLVLVMLFIIASTLLSK